MLPLMPGRLELQVKADLYAGRALAWRERAEHQVRLEELQGRGQFAPLGDRPGGLPERGGDPGRLVAGECLPVEPPAAMLAAGFPADHVPAEPPCRVRGIGELVS